MRRCYELSLALALATVAFAQAPVPVIAPGGVQNTASNVALSSIAPQMLITIRGQNLASYTQTAAGYPLPTTLGGANVSLLGGPFGSPAVQLLYASPSQINALVPGIAGTSLSVTVQTASGAFSSAPYPIPVATGDYPWPVGPLGIFTQDSSGCGQAVAYNVHADGSVSLNTPRNSLDPENDAGLTIYLTGLGSLDFPDLQDGVPWAYNSADNLAPEFGNLAAVMFGAPGLTGTAGGLTLSYLGPAPEKWASTKPTRSVTGVERHKDAKCRCRWPCCFPKPRVPRQRKCHPFFRRSIPASWWMSAYSRAAASARTRRMVVWASWPGRSTP
jgi:uncharacterized protein (TIGR03437 family)